MVTKFFISRKSLLEMFHAAILIIIIVASNSFTLQIYVALSF